MQRVHLGGLSQAAIGEVAERLCEVNLSESAIKLIYQQTDGNPLFAIELIKVLMDESAGDAIAAMPARIPAGVRETIGRRLSRLSDECNELLCVAAVHGRQFTAREIAVGTDQNVQRVLTVLEPAVQAGIVQSHAEVVGGYQFTHGLIRETIYEDMPTVDRLRVHGRAGDALVAVHSANLEPALSRIAHHYHQAAALGYSEKAVAYALRAAEIAVRIYAYEDALVQYDRAIETLEGGGLIHDERLCAPTFSRGRHSAAGADRSIHRRVAGSGQSHSRFGQRRVAGGRADVPCHDFAACRSAAFRTLARPRIRGAARNGFGGARQGIGDAGIRPKDLGGQIPGAASGGRSPGDGGPQL